MHHTRTNRIATASHINGAGRPVNDLSINPMAQTRNITRACDTRVRGGSEGDISGYRSSRAPGSIGPTTRAQSVREVVGVVMVGGVGGWVGGWVADRANEGSEVVRETQTPSSARRFCRLRVQHSILIACRRGRHVVGSQFTFDFKKRWRCTAPVASFGRYLDVP